jgi:hypothetical protein
LRAKHLERHGTELRSGITCDEVTAAGCREDGGWRETPRETVDGSSCWRRRAADGEQQGRAGWRWWFVLASEKTDEWN